MSEIWLLIETSGRIGKVGLARGESVVRAVELDATRRHARDLSAAVDALLKGESLRPADLTGIMVSRGPGSYTGLRVGVMSAKALAYATGCRLVAVDTFAAITMQSPAEAHAVWVIADALQGMIYRQHFVRSQECNLWLHADELRIDCANDWLGEIAEGSWVSGPGVKQYADRIPQSCHLVAEADREPTAESVYRVGQHTPALTREALFALEPLYLRGSSAEEKAKAQMK